MLSRIMIVDDAGFMRVMLKDILSKNGYEVIAESENGIQAVEKYGELKPDLVLMDIAMPQMDGIAALKEIKKIDKYATVIMCSSMGEPGKVRESLQAGARDFILKPFRADQILVSIKRCLNL